MDEEKNLSPITEITEDGAQVYSDEQGNKVVVVDVGYYTLEAAS